MKASLRFRTLGFRVILAMISLALVATAADDSASAGSSQPSRTFEHIRGDAWGFALFPVLESKVAHLIPEGWEPIACRMRGQTWPLPAGTVQVLLVGKRDYPNSPDLPDSVTHWTLGLCADPPSEDMLYEGQVHRGLALRSWIDSAEAKRFEDRFGLGPQLADIKINGDVEARDWGIEVRSPDGSLEFEADFKIDSEKQCVMTGESARLYAANEETGVVGAADVIVPVGNLEACYGSRTIVTADPGTLVAEVLGTPAVATVAGVEKSDDHITRYTRLRNPGGK